MATTLYISGFGSTYKPYIPRLLSTRWGDGSIYYVLKNVLREDQVALEAYCRSANSPIRIIGHSTGGFWGLYLSTLFPGIVSLHLINPAIDLLWSLDRNPQAAEFLEERKFIEAAFARITDHHRFPRFPLTVYQGRYDDRVNVPFNTEFVEKVGGSLFFYELGHRFDEQQLEGLLDDMVNNGLERLW